MANKSKKNPVARPAEASSENVVRIKAGASSSKKTRQETVVAADTSTVQVVKAAKTDKPAKVAKVKKVRSGNRGIRGLGVFGAIGRYFKGAWVELRLVRWPNRRATWSLTGAVLLFSAFFVIVVLLLDALFKYLFDLILGK